MEIVLINAIKILANSITVIFGFICAYIELKFDSKSWLNRIFASFFIFLTFGFLFSAIYHSILNNAQLVLIFAYFAWFFLHLGVASLLLTSFIVESQESNKISKSYLLITLGVYFSSIFGYFIWIPKLNMDEYSQGIVDTRMDPLWELWVNIYRFSVLLFVLIKFHLISKNGSPRMKHQMKFFIQGLTLTLSGIILNITFFFVSEIASLLVEVICQIIYCFGAFMILKGVLPPKLKIKDILFHSKRDF